MSADVDSEVLEEGEIEDEEDEIQVLGDFGSGRPNPPDENVPKNTTTNDRKSFNERRSSRQTCGKSPTRQAHWEGFPVSRHSEQVLLPLTRGGYWAPPPLLPTPAPSSSSSPSSLSPGSRVFHFLRNRTKSSDNESKDIENRRPSNESRSAKRKTKTFPKHLTRAKQSDEDSDFEILLKKHKEIQAQLAKLKTEEEKSDIESSVIDISTPVNETTKQPQTGDTPEVVVISDEGIDTSTVSLSPEAKDNAENTTAQATDNNFAEAPVKTPDDDDLDALELRKLALESVVEATGKKNAEFKNTDVSETKSSTERPSHSSNDRNSSSKRSRSRSGGSKSSKSGKKSETSSRSGGSQSKGYSLPHRDRGLVSPGEKVDRYGRQRRLRKSSSSQRELERRRREAEDKRRQAERARVEERRKRFEQRQKEAADKQRQREEIQKILALSDPAEQVEKFLKLVKIKGSNQDRKNKSPAKCSSGRQSGGGRPSSGGRNEKKTPQKLEDNYEEVEMEIDSDSPTLPSIEGFQMETDDMSFLNTMPPHLQVFPGMDSYPLTSFSNMQVLSEWPVKRFDTWIPPLPPEEPPPPPPADCPPPPTPPAPPLPEDPCPEMGSPRQVVETPHSAETEDADEESLLREQLLKSMAMKRQKTTTEAHESGSSSVQSPCGSPAPTSTPVKTRKVIVKESKRSKNTRNRPFQPPIHKPVVIKLGESSDDSDGEAGVQSGPSPVSMLGGIDSFLKQVRKSVEQQKRDKSQNGGSPVVNSVRSGLVEDISDEHKSEAVDVKQMEEQLVTLRKDTLKEQSVLKMLINQFNKCQTNRLIAEDRLRKIEEQLAAVQKIAAACGNQAQKVRLQVRGVRKSVKEKVASYRLLEEQTLTKGQTVFGQNYKLPVQLVNKKAVKRKTKDNLVDIQKKVMYKKFKETSNPGSPVSKMTPSEIIEEKTRLQELEQEYAKKIRELKLSQAKQDVLRNQPEEKENPINPADIPSLDKIYIGNCDINDPLDKVEKSVTRRRSLLDLNFSTKPNIVQHEKEDPGTQVQQSTGKKKGLVFTLPDGQQRQNLQQLEGEKLEKLLKSFPQAAKPNLWNGDVSNTPIPHVEQVSCIDLESKFTNTRKTNVSDLEQVDPSPLLYQSPLLHFRSYRLSRYYRTKEQLLLSSTTFSNKLDPKKHLCRFELQGTCNDEVCPWQHEKDYILSARELLMDILSYSPKLAGVSETTDLEDYKTKLEKYVDKLINQHSDHMNTDQLCVFLVSEVHKLESLAHPWNVQMVKRVWKPHQTERVVDKSSQQKSDTVKSSYAEKQDYSCGLSAGELDNIISEQDVRYFLDGPEMQEVESTILQQPTNVHLWISLAYKKLQVPQSESGDTLPLDLCLNVLARGLELNKNNNELWYHYLKLYKHHPHSEDIQDLCETALTCAPSYQIFQQYLNVVVSFTEKELICKRLIEYLLTCGESNTDLHSFHCLEAVVHLVDLYVQSGRYKTGLLYLQSLLPVDGKPASLLLSMFVPLDICIIWLTFISLSQFHQLPAPLIEPANQNPGKIVLRKVFQLPWESHPELSANVETILGMLEKALRGCCSQEALQGEHQQLTEVDKEIKIALYMNILTVQQLFVSPEKAQSTCRELLIDDWKLPQYWTLASSVEYNTGNIPAAIKMIQDGLTTHSHCAKLYYSAANLYLTQHENDNALAVLEQCVIALYKVDIADYKTCDPNLLYCKTLHQPVPLNYKAPGFADGVAEITVEKQIGSLWLNYCLLLELQGDHSQAVESFETALGLLHSSQLSLLWKGYLQFHQRQMSSLPAGQRQKAVMTLTHLVHRCLTSFPVKRDLPFCSPGHWLDYTDHNDMVEVFLRSIPTEDSLVVYRRLVQVMPANVNLAIRAIEHALSTEDYMEAQGLCNAVLFEQVANCRLWKLGIGLALKMKNYRQVRKLYKKAVRKLPLMFTLWKDFLLFEVTQGSESGAVWIIEQCQKLGVNIKGFVATVSKLPM